MTDRLLNILLVDDDEDDFLIVRSLLSKVEGQFQHLTWSSSYDAALEAMQKKAYDVYLVDYRLGARDGLSLLREAREQGCREPMILLTGQGGHRIDLEAMRAGAADYLVKGEIDASMLERSIRYAVERAHTLETLSRQTAKLAASNRELEEKDRLLAAYHQIGRVTLSSLDLDEVLDNLATHIVEVGIFRSIMIALVNEKAKQVEIVRSFVRQNGPKVMTSKSDIIGLCYGLGDENITAEVARTGQMQIVEGWDTRFDSKVDTPKTCKNKVSFFIPVKQGDRVLAVLATAARTVEKAEVLHRIEIMHPLLDQVAIALDHANTNRQLKEAQAHLIQWEKMASLGQMAAGIAHEINNPVGFVMSNLQTLGDYVATFKRTLEAHQALFEAVKEADGEARDEAIEQIEGICSKEDLGYVLNDVDALISESRDGIQRVKEIVQGLKNFARMDGCKLREADINASIEDALKIVWNEIKYKSRINKKLGPLPPVRCCPGQLSQVFINLLVNAAQAIAEHGEITVETQTTDAYVVVRVADTGTGIPQAIRHRIFEPFFTTKPAGKGTGLGLAISYSIIQAHKGKIEVESAEGKGTVFTVKIPKNLEGELLP